MIKRIVLLLVLVFSIKATAQRTNSSPYSFFGIGQEFKSRTVEQSLMGGLGASFNDSYHLNFTNPALLSTIKFTTYTFGGLVNDLTIKDNTTSQQSTSTSIQYAAVGFPLGDKAGFVVGLQPNSSVGYSLFDEIKNTSGDVTEITKFEGNGGTNRIFGGFGMKLYKGFSVGLEAEYIFGNIENEVINQRANITLATKNKETFNVRGSGFKLGFHYTKELKNKLNLNIGIATKLENDLRATGNEYLYSLSFGASGNEIPRDTVSSVSLKSKIKNPLRTTMGIGIGKTDKWYTGVEYEFQGAINPDGFFSSNGNKYQFGDSNRISLGGFYIPRINSISSYWDRVTYRAGLRFENTGLLVNGSSTGTSFSEINDFGISFGIGLPMGRKLSNVNLGVEYGSKGTTKNNLIKENYFNFRLSLSLTDKWFRKRRID